MKLVLALALLSHQEPATSVVGLLDGERAWSSDPRPRLLALLEPSESRIPLAMGRLVDGCTGEPISGARVEVFLEDFWGPLDAPPTVGRGSEVATATNEDGSWILHLPDAVDAPAKLRFSAAGYRTEVEPLTVTLDEEFALLPPDGLQVQVLDLAGSPVESAVIWTEQTCRHDPPGLSGQADDRGMIQLGARPAIQLSEGRLAAPGFAALEDFDLDGLWGDVAAYGEATLFLPRMAPITYRFTESPQTNRAILVNEPERSAVIEADLTVEFDSPGATGGRDRGEQVLWLPTSSWARGYRTIPLPRPLPSRVLAIDPNSPEPDPPGPEARVTIRLPDLNEADLATVPLTVIHESGFWNYPKATVEDGCMVSSASAGRTTFVLGGDFSGWREQVLELDLSAGAHEVRVDIAREPLLELRASDPSRLTGEVWIQVGQDSVLWRGKALPIPPGREVVVLGQPEDGSVWRLTANPAEVNLVLDVDSAEHVRGRRADAVLQTSRIEFQALDPSGTPRPIAGAIVYLGSAMTGEEEALELYPEDGVTSVAFDLPRGMDYRALIDVEGHLSRWTIGTVGDPGVVSVNVEKPALVEFEGDIHLVLAGGTYHEDMERPMELSPGRHDLLLLRKTGECVRVELDLRPGATRSLTWR